MNNLWEIIENFQSKKIKLSDYEKLFKNESDDLVLSNYLKTHLEFDMSFIKKLKGNIFNENIEQIYDVFYKLIKFPFYIDN